MKRDINIVIKVQGAAKAKKQIRDIISPKTLKNTDKFNKKTKRSSEVLKKQGRSAERAKNSFRQYTRAIFSSLAVIGLFTRGVQAAFRVFEEGGILSRTRVQFKSLVGDVNTLLPVMRAATRDTVSDLKLLQASNRAVMEGMKPAMLEKMFKMSTIASRKLGLTAAAAVETVRNAITRHDESALTSLGIIVKNNKAYQSYMSILKSTGKGIAPVMKIQHRMNFIMGELNKKFGKAGKLLPDAKERIDQLRTAFTNFRATLGSFIGLALEPFIEAMTVGLTRVREMMTMMTNNESFKSFARTLAVVAGSIGAIAAIKGLATLIAFLGLLPTLAAVKIYAGVGLLAGAFKLLGYNIEDVGAELSKILTGFKVFFQLLSSYNAETGYSKVLKKDVAQLGSMYGIVVRLAKVFKVFQAIATGVWRGLKIMLSPIRQLLDDSGSSLSAFFKAMETGAPLSKIMLKSITNGVERLIGSFQILVKIVTDVIRAISYLGNLGGDAGFAAAGEVADLYKKGAVEYTSDLMESGYRGVRDIITQGTKESQGAKVDYAERQQEVGLSAHNMTFNKEDEAIELQKKIYIEQKKIAENTEKLKDHEDQKNRDKVTPKTISDDIIKDYRMNFGNY